MAKVWFAAMIAVCACGTQRVNVCNVDSDCKDPSYPFCDVNGEYPASGGQKQVCTVVPDNCPIDRCGCTANAVLSCNGDQLTSCSPDGKSTAAITCALGCSSDGTRCQTFEPSNGLGAALSMAAAEPDVTIPSGARIDTDVGTVQTANGIPVMVRSVLVAQTGGPSIRAFIAHSFVINDVRITGADVVAFVSTEEIQIQGVVDASAHSSTSGPGAEGSPFLCSGGNSRQSTCTPTTTPGAGGAGNATDGGGGGYSLPATGEGAKGMMIQAFQPFYGGCRGGDLDDSSGNLLASGGGGGGALQLVSMRDVTLSDHGFINVGGGGGASSAGGGSGGTVFIEAPILSITGSLAGIAANGGSGGGCSTTGADGTMTTAAATTSGCSSAGTGGTQSAVAGSGAKCTGTCPFCPGGAFSGGGGSVGRMVAKTRDGMYVTSGTPVISVAITAGTLSAQ